MLKTWQTIRNRARLTDDRMEGGGSWSGDQNGLRDHLTGDEKKYVLSSETAQMISQKR